MLRRALCEQLLDNDNAFLKAFHQQRENRSVEISAWQPRPGLGEVRVANYISPVSVRCLGLAACWPVSHISSRTVNLRI